MFQQILDELVQCTHARAAAFCDYEGEAVAVSPAGEGDYEIKVAGATMCAAQMLLRETSTATGAVHWIATRTERSAILMALLKDGYYVILLVDAGRGEGLARHQLVRAATRILGEM